MKSPVILIILDGWGIAPPGPSNAIALANTPFMDKLQKTYPFILLDASGQTVGLPWGTIGNSEVGHSIIGAGRVVYQDLPRINQSILDGGFFENQAFLKAIDHVKKNNSNLHLIGLVSGAGGHSYDKHLYSLLELARKANVQNVFIHAILDGRDSPYNSGLQFITDLVKETQKIGVGKIATLSGRYFAMDRDKHWERTSRAYSAMVEGKTDLYHTDPLFAIQERYKHGSYDEEFLPVVIVDESKNPVAKIADHDSVILFNFRPDRIRQLTKALALQEFQEFKRSFIQDLFIVTMTQYDISLPVEIAFKQEATKESLPEIVSRSKMFQLHIAETEKYAHITYFFGGGHEEPWLRQDNMLVASPRVFSHVQKPEMSAKKVAGKVIEAIKTQKYSFVAVNFANADMVGHTGNFEATIKAIEVLDKCVQRIVTMALKFNNKVLITADHGNAEQMRDEEGELDKEHTDNPVPFFMIGRDFKKLKFISSRDYPGALYDVAPTILDLLNLSKPSSMTGKSLLQYLDMPIIKKEFKKPPTFLARFLERLHLKK